MPTAPLSKEDIGRMIVTEVASQLVPFHSTLEEMQAGARDMQERLRSLYSNGDKKAIGKGMIERMADAADERDLKLDALDQKLGAIATTITNAEIIKAAESGAREKARLERKEFWKIWRGRLVIIIAILTLLVGFLAIYHVHFWVARGDVSETHHQSNANLE